MPKAFPRCSRTLKSLNLGHNGLREGGGRALAETLRLNSTLTSLDLGDPVELYM